MQEMRDIFAEPLCCDDPISGGAAECTADRKEVREPRTPEPGSVILTGAEKEAAQGRIFVPERFYRPANQQGTLLRLRYTTRNYASDGRKREKDAIVYLPFGYDRAPEGSVSTYSICFTAPAVRKYRIWEMRHIRSV